MKLEVKEIPAKLITFLSKFRKYVAFVLVVLLLSAYGYMVWTINGLATKEPSEDALSEKLQTVKRTRIDEKIVQQIEQLEDNSVEVQALFKQARDNPFQE